jgi:hypothetical protein
MQESDIPAVVNGLNGLAKVLGCGKTTAHLLVKNRKIACVRPTPGSLLFTREAIIEFLKRNEVPAFDAKAAARKIVRS